MNADNTIRAVDHPITILIPVYNDWEALDSLLGLIDQALHDRALQAGVLVIDDGSIADPPSTWNEGRGYRALLRVDHLPIKRNLGHQRALAIGIAYTEHRGTCEELIVMDGDGEDDPKDIPRLIERSRADSGRSIVFAERTKRSEAFGFRMFYVLYKALYRILTGQEVRVGNFSLIPRPRLASLSVVSELWIHYAAAAFRSRQPVILLPTVRATRLRGESRMNFEGLVMHGLSAISVNGDLMGVRLLILAACLAVVDVLALAATLILRMGADVALPAACVFAALGFLLVNLMAMTAQYVILMLNRRFVLGFLPKRDHVFYHESARPLVTWNNTAKPESSRGARPGRKAYGDLT